MQSILMGRMVSMKGSGSRMRERTSWKTQLVFRAGLGGPA